MIVHSFVCVVWYIHVPVLYHSTASVHTGTFVRASLKPFVAMQCLSKNWSSERLQSEGFAPRSSSSGRRMRAENMLRWSVYLGTYVDIDVIHMINGPGFPPSF